MKDTTIILKWWKNAKVQQKEIKREEFYNTISKTINTEDMNMVKLKEILPKVCEIYVNCDFNSTQDIPGVWLYTEESNSYNKIRRANKNFWMEINNYCQWKLTVKAKGYYIK